MPEVIRNNLAGLDDQERIRITEALNQLRTNGRIDHYDTIHAAAWFAAHMGPAFMPWHREYLRRFEHDLQNAVNDDTLGLPYWDWTSTNLDRNGDSLIWRDDLLGGPGDVTDGAFRDWGLRRGNFVATSSPGDNGVSDAMDDKLYRQFRPSLEGQPHGGAHVWVGGLLGDPATAAKDPIFYMLHANVDRLWAHWQTDRRREWEDLNPGQPYPDDQMAADYFWDRSAPNRTWERRFQSTGHNLDDDMWPWNGRGASDSGVTVPPWNQAGNAELVHPRDVLDHRSLNYRYDDEPPAVTVPIS